MKKKVLGLMMAFLAATPCFANAEETFQQCLTGTESRTCTLTENIELVSTVEVKGNIALDLAGYTITSNATTAIKLESGRLVIKDTSSSSNGKIEVSGEAFRVGKKSLADDNKDTAVLTIEKGVDVISTNDSCVVIYAGTLNTAGNLTTKGGNYSTITGSGNDHGTLINITDGTITHETDLAVYHPQEGILNVSGGTITGKTGIEIRGGELTVTGGTITGVYIPTEAEANGNGSTTMGAGIAVAQHNTKLPIKVTISGGIIRGYTALYESNPQKNSKEDIDKINITVNGGVLETINNGTRAIFSENNCVTITAGEFNGEVSEDLVTKEEGKNLYEVETEEGTKYVVATEEDVVLAPYETTAPLPGEEYEEMLTKVEEEQMDDETKKAFNDFKKLLEDRKIVSVHEIEYKKFIEESLIVEDEVNQPAEGTKVKITLELPENLAKVKEGYTRKYVVIRIHDNEDGSIEVKELEALEEEGKVTFETEKFSGFILAYEDVLTIDNAKTFDGISLYMIIGSVSLIGLVALFVYAKKTKSC